MDLQFFQTFLTVAQLGNMTKAAEQLNFTQPTITGQIRALEQHYGVLLFDRVGKKLYITDAGRELVFYAEKLLKTYDETEKALSAHPGNIKIGIGSQLVNYILAPFLQEFQLREPNCSVSIEMCANSLSVVHGLIETRFDLGFIQKEEIAVDCLTGFEVVQEQLVWVVHKQLAERHNFSRNILDYPLLKYKPGGLFHKLYETMGPKKDEPTIEYNDSEAMKNAILLGLGCGALPLVMIQQLLADGTLIEFTNVRRLAFSVLVVFHKDKVLSRAAKNLKKILQGP